MKKLFIFSFLMLIVSVSFAQLDSNKPYTKSQSNDRYPTKTVMNDSLALKLGITDAAATYLTIASGDTAAYFTAAQTDSVAQAKVDSLGLEIINPNTGLIAYFKLNEASGDAIDVISANHLDCSSITYSATGQVGTAYTFNGTSSKVTETTAGLNPSYVTVSCWFKTASTGTIKNLVNNFDEDNYGEGYSLQISAANVVTFKVNNNTFNQTKTVTGTTVVTGDTWFYAVGVSDGTTVKLYINGLSEGTPVAWTNAVTYNSTNRFAIGVQGFSSNYLTGTVDEVKLWNKGLTSEVILTDYLFGKNNLPTK